MTRIAIVEDSPSQLKLLAEVIGAEEDFKLAGLYESGDAALAGAEWAEVDVLLADLELPGLSGVGLIERALSAKPGLLAMAHTVHADRELVFAALEAGALGYVVKGGRTDQLVEAVRDLAQGRSPISPAIARHLIGKFRGGKPEEPLSLREAYLLRLVAEGNSYKEIATVMGISQHTVHTHVQNIYRKLHASSRHDALRRARVLGYFDARAG